MLNAENVTVRYGAHTVVDRLSFSLEDGQWLMLAGPNGAGKSSLISAIAQSVPYEGEIRLNGRNLREFRPAELARKIAVLAQQHTISYGYTVEEIVQLGRYAHQRGLLGRRDEDGPDAIERALELTGMKLLRKRSLLELSGGEVQRAFLAQVLAQEPEILLLDEPANHLDLVYQQSLFSLIGQWLQTPGRAALSVVHDLSIARRYGTHAVLMNDGRAVAQGPIEAVFTPENLQKVYSMDVYGWMSDLYALWQDPVESQPRLTVRMSFASPGHPFPESPIHGLQERSNVL